MQARSIPCPHCGGIFPVADVASGMQCPYCACRFALTAAAVAELERYQHAVHEALGQANVEHQHGARWNTTAQTVKTGWVALVVFFVLVGVLLIGTVVLQAALTAGLMPSKLIPLFSIGMVVGVIVITVSVSVWLSIRASRSPDEASAGSAQVACPSCGAPNQLGSGQTLETCRYCRAALVPSRTVMAHGMDLARTALRAAELQRFRAERVGMAAITGRTLVTAGPYIVLGSFVPMTGGSVVVMAGQLVLGDGDVPLPALAAVLLLASLNIGLIAGLYAWRKWHKQRFSTAVTDLARQFHGDLVSGLPGVVAWLNAYWASPYRLHHLSAGPYHVAARIDAGGYAALIDVDPVSAATQYKPRVHILVAATVPEHATRAASPAVAAARRWLEQAGFTVSIESSGLLARAGKNTLKRLRKSPDSLHVLSTVITTLAGLARGLGAEPVDALP